MKRRTDNMPEKITAHVVRRLVGCRLCGGLGDRSMMIESDTHTSCFSEKFGFKGLMGLSRESANKMRLCDIEKLNVNQQRAFFRKATAK
jgi:hypothetical protein